MAFPASLSIVNALLAVDAVIADKHFRQFVHLRSFELRSHECSLIDLRQPSGQYLRGFVVVSCLCAFAEYAAMTVVLNPPHSRVFPPIETAFRLRFHHSPFPLFLTQRAWAAFRAISFRCSSDVLLSRAFPAFLAIAERSA